MTIVITSAPQAAGILADIKERAVQARNELTLIAHELDFLSIGSDKDIPEDLKEKAVLANQVVLDLDREIKEFEAAWAAFRKRQKWGGAR